MRVPLLRMLFFEEHNHAYPEGEAYADQGYVLTLEARYQLPKFSDQHLGRVQLIGFVDIFPHYSWPLL